MAIASFPWHALPMVSAAEMRAVSAVRSAYANVRLADVAHAITSLVGHPVAIEIRRRALLPPARVDLGSKGPALVLGSDARVIAVELEAELVLAVISSLAGGKSLPRIAKGRSVDPELAGAAAGVLQWLARESGIDDARIVRIEPSPEELRWSLGIDDVLVLDLAVRVGTLRTAARVGVRVPPAASIAPSDPTSTLKRLGATPLSIEVVLGAGRASLRDVGAIGVGDVVVVDRRFDASTARRCVLAPKSAEHGVEGRMLEAAGSATQRIRIEGGRVDLAELAAERAPADIGGAMADADPSGVTAQVPAIDEGGPLGALLADAPVEVRIEVGSVTMPAREWAGMTAGDVVVLDRKVGDAVTLRVGGRAMARGELVDVDGALGVRITERLP